MPLDEPRCIQLHAEAFGKFGPRRKITAERKESRRRTRFGAANV